MKRTGLMTIGLSMLCAISFADDVEVYIKKINELEIEKQKYIEIVKNIEANQREAVGVVKYLKKMKEKSIKEGPEL